MMSLLKSRRVSQFRRKYFNLYTKKEMALAYKAGIYHVNSSPDLITDEEKKASFAEFYITMDLHIDADN